MPVAALPVTWEAGVSLVAPRGREAPLLQAAIDLQEKRTILLRAGLRRSPR